jgi:hypothetical protein
MCAACLPTIFWAHHIPAIRARVYFTCQEEGRLLREDLLACKLTWLGSNFLVCSLCHCAVERLPEASAVIFDKRQIATAITEIIESLFKGRATPVVVQAWSIRHPGLRLWLWFRLRFRFGLRLWFGLWLRFWLWH